MIKKSESGGMEAHAHPFAPVVDANCRILIVGSFPSVLSRKHGFYYGNPQNRFWPMLQAVFQEAVPASIEGKVDFLLRHHIALWDVVERCEIKGSSDASLRQAVPQNLSAILHLAPIARVLANGKLAGALCEKALGEDAGRLLRVLPSTSPANAAWRLPQLIEVWREALNET